jgi:hypothetical protein
MLMNSLQDKCINMLKGEGLSILSTPLKGPTSQHPALGLSFQHMNFGVKGVHSNHSTSYTAKDWRYIGGTGTNKCKEEHYLS